MEFKVLGPIQVANERLAYTPSAPKVKQVLALLVMRANQIVTLESIIDELWGDHAPRTAVTTAQTYIYQLRKDFVVELGEECGERIIVTARPGYVLSVPEGSLDVHNFERLADRAHACSTAGDAEGTARWTQAALRVWRGSPLADIPCGRVLQDYVSNLQEKRVSTQELSVRAAMDLERYRDLITELRSLVMEYPFNEWFHTQLVRVLNKAGRRVEALHAYQEARVLLRDELGLGPSHELRRAQQEVLGSAP
ncbi:SARP family transcriptional regulator [Streptomyces platensis]|uniref:SARP family transcriptional regulator n=1 Tax=Streptomyces platensis TaxID=58346 RepID=A0AAE6NQY2_STRPT|nr:AfsR/SARP family transcriptional regulator [Streptomyces platensis]OSY48321.1 Transcriptional regulatory protein EmbR [Streptomyces platensis]QEV56046.1 SARP family transcriptional regulator [Streptomyces platensis]